MIRTEFFENTDAKAPTARAFVGILEALEHTEEGKVRICACVTIFGESLADVDQKATDWLTAERERVAKLEGNATGLGERSRRRA